MAWSNVQPLTSRTFLQNMYYCQGNRVAKLLVVKKISGWTRPPEEKKIIQLFYLLLGTPLQTLRPRSPIYIFWIVTTSNHSSFWHASNVEQHFRYLALRFPPKISLWSYSCFFCGLIPSILHTGSISSIIESCLY